MDINKELTTLAKQLVQQKIAGCKDCNEGVLLRQSIACREHCAINEIDYKIGQPDCIDCDVSDCPTCTDLRALDKELCWHEQEGVSLKCLGGTVKLNPTCTIQSLRQLLERMGYIDDFMAWVWAIHIPKCSELERVLRFGKICQSDELMAQSVLEYFKGRVK